MLQLIVRKGKELITVRSGELLETAYFQLMKETLSHTCKYRGTSREVIAYALYPKVLVDYQKNVEQYGNPSIRKNKRSVYAVSKSLVYLNVCFLAYQMKTDTQSIKNIIFKY